MSVLFCLADERTSMLIRESKTLQSSRRPGIWIIHIFFSVCVWVTYKQFYVSPQFSCKVINLPTESLQGLINRIYYWASWYMQYKGCLWRLVCEAHERSAYTKTPKQKSNISKVILFYPEDTYYPADPNSACSLAAIHDRIFLKRISHHVKSTCWVLAAIHPESIVQARSERLLRWLQDASNTFMFGRPQGNLWTWGRSQHDLKVVKVNFARYLEPCHYSVNVSAAVWGQTLIVVQIVKFVEFLCKKKKLM